MALTHEEIVRIRVRTADAEELHEIVKLAVYVTAHCHRAFLFRVVSGLAAPTGNESSRTTGCTFDSSCSTSLACERRFINSQSSEPTAEQTHPIAQAPHVLLC